MYRTTYIYRTCWNCCTYIPARPHCLNVAPKYVSILFLVAPKVLIDGESTEHILGHLNGINLVLYFSSWCCWFINIGQQLGFLSCCRVARTRKLIIGFSLHRFVNEARSSSLRCCRRISSCFVALVDDLFRLNDHDVNCSYWRWNCCVPSIV